MKFNVSSNGIFFSKLLIYTASNRSEGNLDYVSLKVGQGQGDMMNTLALKTVAVA